MLTLTPIGTVRTGKGTKFAAGHQPDPSAPETHVIELVPGMELAVQDLATFDHIWLIWWFDQNKSWRQRVLPPRGPAVRRGVLATRSPHRPNPLGLTCVRLLSVDGLNLTVGPLDLLDGTPIFDIKPYLTTVDCFPEASLGWLTEVDSLSPQYDIVLSPLAMEQMEWLREEWGVDFWTRASQVLALDPCPHRTRRILAMGDCFRMACGPWRVFFRVEPSKRGGVRALPPGEEGASRLAGGRAVDTFGSDSSSLPLASLGYSPLEKGGKLWGASPSPGSQEKVSRLAGTDEVDLDPHPVPYGHRPLPALQGEVSLSPSPREGEVREPSERGGGSFTQGSQSRESAQILAGTVTILEIGTGYSDSDLARAGNEKIADRDAQRAFRQRWASNASDQINP